MPGSSIYREGIMSLLGKRLLLPFTILYPAGLQPGNAILGNLELAALGFAGVF